jgi:Contractile injection system tube protein
MPDAANLAKAKIEQLDSDFKNTINPDKATIVQFNPDSLKVSFANQVATPSGSGDQSGPQARQFVGAGTTKLAVTLTFDVTSEIPQELPQVDDVRQLTQRVAYFITPLPDPPNNPTKYFPPGVRFSWGSFQFDGIMDSMEETLDLFSFEGRPLRATVAVALSQQKITAFIFNQANAAPPATRQGGPALGTSPLTEATAGASLQSLTANLSASGSNADWQSIASANGIENPRLLKPGQLIDLNPPSLQFG